jgi:protein-tyrosine phosphatase
MTTKKILFVCLGNICRSPAAEGIMNSIIKGNNMEEIITVDSAGTIPYHRGELPDERMRKHAGERGYNLTHRSRLFDPEKDFILFDYIVVMDSQNYEDIKSHDLKGIYTNKIFKMVQFCKKYRMNRVPDPYNLGPQGFEDVLNILEDGCSGLFNKVKDEIRPSN